MRIAEHVSCFLITTADPRFHGNAAEALLLGEWCRIYGSNSFPDAEILPYHWDDRKKLLDDMVELEDLTEKFLSALSVALNAIHGINHSQRFWRIILGPWLIHFLEIAFDRFTCIQRAGESRDDLTTFVMPIVKGRWTPNDMGDFFEEFVSDAYNLHLYGHAARFLKRIRLEEKEPETKDQTPPAPSRGFKQYLKRLGTAHAPFLRRQSLFVRSAFPKGELARLQFALGNVPVLDTFSSQVPKFGNSSALREQFDRELRSCYLPKSSFEEFFCKILADQIPKAYLEGFGELSQVSRGIFPKRSRTILSATAHVDHEPFKHWAAEQVERGAKLAVIQHGGHHGTGWCAIEQHEMKIADRYYSWGWSENEKVKAMPSPKLLKARPTSPERTGPILLVLNSFPRYSYRLYTVPIAGQALEFIQDQVTFLKSLSSPARGLVEVRLYPTDYGWREEQRLRDEFPDLRLTKTGMSLVSHMKKSRLFIGTHNTTTHLESLSRNFPTVLYWNPRHWELRDSAKPFYDSLREVGILHDCPNKAAEHVNAIYQNCADWWSGANLQKVRERFCRQFAKHDRNWCRVWKSEIVALAQESQR